MSELPLPSTLGNHRSGGEIPPVASSIPWMEPGDFCSARAMSLMDSPALHRFHSSFLPAADNPPDWDGLPTSGAGFGAKANRRPITLTIQVEIYAYSTRLGALYRLLC